MENHIENIELINSYLNKSLSEKDNGNFEKRLKTDATFKEEYETHIVFLEGLKRQSLIGEIAKAKQIYLRNKWFKFLGISFGVLVVSVFVYFNLSKAYPDKNYLKNKLNFESEFVQVFNVKVDSIIEIVGKKGTIIKFNPNDLKTSSNKLFSGDSLNIKLIELVNKQDLLLANAQTISDGKWLISGGAFKIDITANGEPLVLKEGKTIEAKFPKNTSEGDMQIFYGDRDEEGNVNWVESNVKLKQNPFVIFINEGFVVDSVLSKRHGVDWFKGVGVIDTIGFMSFTDLKKKFPKINLYKKDTDTIRVLKKGVRIIDDYYDGERDDLVNPFRVESIDELYNKKDIIIDSTLIDLEEYVGSELREIYGKVCKQISKQELDLEDVISKVDYEKRRLSYDNTIKEIQIYNKVSNNFYESVKLSKLGWINVDKFVLNEEKVNVKFNFNVKTNHNEIYVIDKKNNTVLNVYSNQVDLPINRSFYIIAIGIKGKDVYGFKKSDRFSKKGNLKVDYKQVNESQIRGLLTID